MLIHPSSHWCTSFFRTLVLPEAPFATYAYYSRAEGYRLGWQYAHYRRGTHDPFRSRFRQCHVSLVICNRYLSDRIRCRYPGCLHNQRVEDCSQPGHTNATVLRQVHCGSLCNLVVQLLRPYRYLLLFTLILAIGTRSQCCFIWGSLDTPHCIMLFGSCLRRRLHSKDWYLSSNHIHCAWFSSSRDWALPRHQSAGKFDETNYLPSHHWDRCWHEP